MSCSKNLGYYCKEQIEALPRCTFQERNISRYYSRVPIKALLTILKMEKTLCTSIADVTDSPRNAYKKARDKQLILPVNFG